MKFGENAINEELKNKIVAMINNAPKDGKATAIFESIAMINEAVHGDLIAEILEQSEKAAADESYRNELNLHVLSAEEKTFYEKIINPQQSFAFKQEDILPVSIVNRTMEDVRKASNLLDLVDFAPAGVMKWITGSHSGAAVWGALDASITGELSAEISTLDLEDRKMTVFMVIPKSIRDLALPFVDKYFKAILAEGVQDGLEKGYLNGDGKTGPVGITKTISGFKSDGTADAKVVAQNITVFSPKGLAEVKKTLSNEGKRAVTELALICNPLDEAEYVDPCLYGQDLNGNWHNTSFMPIKKYVTPNIAQGTAVLTLPGVYTMGIARTSIKEYDQTKAMEDQDLLIAKVYANGRADDDNAAVVFNVAKLKEYTPVAVPAPAKA